jgi:hypothetical protein
LFLIITFANFFKGEKMLALPIIVHHKTDPKLRAGIVVAQQVVQVAASQLNPNQVIPVVLCSVVWDEGHINEQNEIVIPADADRLDAICLHQASELVFDGPYTPVEEEEEEEEEETANGEEVVEGSPESAG